jgi:hypothetical protein
VYVRFALLSLADMDAAMHGRTTVNLAAQDDTDEAAARDLPEESFDYGALFSAIRSVA